MATEALQCPTLLANGFGAHRIEGIGDKHVPWVHNVRNTDMVAAIDDEQCMSLLRLFNEEEGVKFLAEQRRARRTSSSSCRWSASPASATWSRRSRRRSTTSWTGATSSSRRSPTRWTSTPRASRSCATSTARTPASARRSDFARYLEGAGTDDLRELGYPDRKPLHNLKYFTWVEQQGKTSEELAALWEPDFWTETCAQVDEWDQLIQQFNERTGVLKTLA